MIIRYDLNIPGVETLEGNRTLFPFDPAQLKSTDAQVLRKELTQADAWFIRTVTKITPEEFPELECSDNQVRFIATASAGTDHVDERWLKHLGIHFAHASGCNARAVAEYVASSLLIWLEKERRKTDRIERDQNRLIVGLFGAGATGSATASLLKKIGFDVLLYDPPKELRENASGQNSTFKSCSLEELKEADIWSLHVPLITHGVDATTHLINQDLLFASKVRLIIQASRGGVLDESALWMQKDPALICDVWEGEPDLSLTTLRRAAIATPHIAGYSLEAKTRATEQIVASLNSFFGAHLHLPKELNKEVFTPNRHLEKHTPPSSLGEVIASLHPIMEFDSALRRTVSDEGVNLAKAFSQLRNTFPLRHELQSICCPSEWHDRYPELGLLGIGAF